VLGSYAGIAICFAIATGGSGAVHSAGAILVHFLQLFIVATGGFVAGRRSKDDRGKHHSGADSGYGYFVHVVWNLKV
jgi:hypothetical protein